MIIAQTVSHENFANCQAPNPVVHAAAANGLALCAETQLLLRDVCRLKGQEENTLQGYGLVVGLKGTGDDSSKPTARALAHMMQKMGGQIANDAKGAPALSEIEKSGNAALVS